MRPRRARARWLTHASTDDDHDLRLLRRRLPPRRPRPRRAGRLDHARARRPGEPRARLPEGPLRAPVRPRPRPPHHAADPRGRRAAAGDLGRGARPVAAEFLRHQGRARRPTRSPASPRRAARTRSATRCSALFRAVDRHAQHRQLLARLPLAHLVRAAPLARALGRERLVRRHRALAGAADHRREPDRRAPGRRRADEAGGAARARSSSPPTRAGSSSPTTASCTARLRAGTNVAFLNGLAHVLIRDGLSTATSSTSAPRTSRSSPAITDELHARPRSSASPASPPPTSSARPTSTARPSARRSPWGLGVTEHRHGSDAVQLIANLALLTGKIGRPGCALLPLRGQNNVQGSSDMGALPDTFTSYRSVDDEETARMFEERWGVSMKRERGLKLPEMLDARDRRPRARDVDLRLRHRAVRSRQRARGRRAREPRVPRRLRSSSRTRPRSFADVVLPAASFLEKTGTYTNAERRLQLVQAGGRPAGRGEDRPRDLRPRRGAARRRAPVGRAPRT